MANKPLEPGKTYYVKVKDKDGNEKIIALKTTQPGEKLHDQGMKLPKNKQVTESRYQRSYDPEHPEASFINAEIYEDPKCSGEPISTNAAAAINNYCRENCRGVMEYTDANATTIRHFHHEQIEQKEQTKTKEKKKAEAKKAKEVQNVEEAAKPAQEEKPSWWERNKNWIYWGLGILGVAGLATIGFLGFRKGGWWNKKKTPQVTPTPSPTPGPDPIGGTVPDVTISSNTGMTLGSESSNLTGTLGANGSTVNTNPTIGGNINSNSGITI